MILTPHRTVPVLIAGAGPAGLTTAISLARAGVACMVVDRRTERSAHPRATGVSTRTMELLRAWGLDQEIRDVGVDAEWRLWTCETLARAADGSGQEVGYPSHEQSAVVSPTAPACVPQDQLEPILLRHLASLEAAQIRLGASVVGVEQFDGGVQAIVRDAGSGETQVVHARHLVGADGAHSSVRDALGIGMHGPDRLAVGLSALFHAPLWELVGAHRYGIYVVSDPAGAGVFLPAGRGDRWLYAVHAEQLPGGIDELNALTSERIAQRIERGAGAPLRPRVQRFGQVVFAAQLAERFRRGDVFLVGDAAHRTSPRGGTGMNTAIADGRDLGWKLAWTLRGWAAPELLDSYEAERRPLAEHNVTRSARPDGSLAEVGQELRVDLGGRIPHAWTAAGRSTLDLLGDGLTLFTAPDGERRWQAAAAATSAATTHPAPPLAVRALDAVTAAALGVRGDGALLVRPDAQPAGWFPPGDDGDDADSAAQPLHAAVAAATAAERPATSAQSPALAARRA
ncbi:FAD-dependent monooxygenase [Conexibacter stalactiti]|uniref:FAD-dependent monooxygenase n=1 Tax=Conexibacter stalactiti TaxID=1940611 RepID=A0ABU4HZU8_9ACTN|nr:FAD-dependent monooxygenase [Conexibacter stalactiti]MDW5598825.1 FAD-dependent monooxygenase [Conexibacter stalactiti]MEC5039467.1 FAD-dependent monooxygenase [Conexibacter stalactiti]